MRLEVDVDRPEVVAVRAELGRAGVRNAARILEGGGVELAAAEGAGKDCGSGDQDLGAGSRRRLAIELDHRRQDHLLASAKSGREVLFETRHRQGCG